MRKLQTRSDVIAVTFFLCVVNILFGLFLENMTTDGLHTSLFPKPYFAVTCLVIPCFIFSSFFYSIRLYSRKEEKKGREILIGSAVSVVIACIAVALYIVISEDFYGFY